MQKILLAGLAVSLLTAAGPDTASALLLFDRGLPIDNLNNSAGVNRSNVAWGFNADDQGPWLAGDDFNIGGVDNYLIETIRVWSVNTDAALTLWLGETGSTFTSFTSSSYQAVTYENGETYQGSGGSYRELRQYDFNINTVLSGNTEYQFFLGGSASGPTFLHASNYSFGGGYHEGADEFLLYAQVTDSGLSNIGSWTSDNNGWDKSSDANIQIFGAAAPVPEPSALLLFGAGLAGLAAVGRRRRS